MSRPQVPLSDDPRSRAARTKRHRTRRALLDAADAAFGSRGWANTRMEDVAQAANVSPATAYNHFPTKHALLAHVYAPMVAPFLAQAEQDVAADRPVVEALEDQVRALCRLSKRNRALTAAFWCACVDHAVRTVGRRPGPDAADGTGAADDADPRALAPVPEALRLLIAHGQASGQLRGYPSAAEVSALVVDTLLVRSVDHADEPQDITAELLLTVMFGMVQPALLAGAERRFHIAR